MKNLFKNFKILSEKNVLVMILCVFLATFFTQIFVIQSKYVPKNAKDNKFINPLWQEYVKIAKHYKIDLNFTKNVWIQRGPVDFTIHDIFKEQEKSFDILMFGDSSLAWGVVPNVIEQITNKKVGIYAYESNLLNVKSIVIFEKIAKYYLKDDGMVIFAFASWTQDVNKDNVLLTLKDKYNKIAKLNDDKFKKFVKFKQNGEMPFFDKYLFLDNFRAKFDDLSQLLKTHQITLKSPQIYGTYMEKFINKKWLNVKKKNQNEKTLYLRWDNKSITQFNKNFQSKAFLATNYQIDANFSSKNLKINSAFLNNKIKAKFRVYMKPISDQNGNFWVNVYEKYYKNNGFIFADLSPFAKEINDKFQITMEGGTHTANTGGVLASIAIAKWINDFYAK